MEPLKLASEFPAATAEQWRAAVDKALKGASFDKRLVSRLYEGIAVQPLYTRQDWPGDTDAAGLPGQAPYTRGARAAGAGLEGWDVLTEQDAAAPQAVNTAILRDLERGATAILLRFDQAARAGLDGDAAAAADLAGRDGAMLYSLDDLDLALKDVFLDMAPVSLDAGAQAVPAAALLMALWRARGITPAQARGAFNADPLGALAASGTLPTALDVALTQVAELADWTAAQWPGVTAVGVDTSAYHEAGATESQDLAIAMATGLAYLRALTDGGMDIDAAAAQIAFTFSVGCDQFLSIAKLRAARRLWARVTGACGATGAGQAMRIHARTSRRMMSRRDPWVNMLRTTVAGFAAGLGGADSVTVLPFDAALGASDDFARRIARNSQILLKEESALAKVIDPAGGSWYVESLTADLAGAAWAVFQDIERRGGMAAALTDGSIAADIAAAWAEREKNIARRRNPLTGVSEFPNILEKPVERPLPDVAALRDAAARRLAPLRASPPPAVPVASLGDLVDLAGARHTLGTLAGLLADDKGLRIAPLPRHRLPEAFEALRDAADRHKGKTGAWPAIFLANIGAVAQHTARATYAKNFFEAGGIQAIGNNGFADAPACAEAWRASGARIAILCGSDAQYEEAVPSFAQALKAAGVEHLFLAGNPGEREAAYRDAGVDDFIVAGGDVLAVLRTTLSRLGVSL